MLTSETSDTGIKSKIVPILKEPGRFAQNILSRENSSGWDIPSTKWKASLCHRRHTKHHRWQFNIGVRFCPRYIQTLSVLRWSVWSRSYPELFGIPTEWQLRSMGNIFPVVGKAWKSSWSRESPRTWFCLSFQGSGRWPPTYTTQRNRYACDLHPYSTLVDPRRLHNIISPLSVPHAHHKYLLKKELLSIPRLMRRNLWGTNEEELPPSKFQYLASKHRHLASKNQYLASTLRYLAFK